MKKLGGRRGRRRRVTVVEGGVPERLWSFCPTPDKVAYADFAAAADAAPGLRPYLCACGKVHVTSARC